MVKLRPSETCCGCASLLVGVEAICMLTLLVCISTIASVSSKGSLELGGPFGAISPESQTFLGTWAFAGIPLAIASGVGVLYRIELPLRLYLLYMLASFFLITGVPSWLLLSGSLCDNVVSPEVQRLGSSFVCGFTDSLTLFWTLLFGTAHMYTIYIVWSAAEEIAASPFPELAKYSDALKNVYKPDPPEDYKYPLGENRATAFPPGSMPPNLLGPSFSVMPPQRKEGEGEEEEQAPLTMPVMKGGPPMGKGMGPPTMPPMGKGGMPPPTMPPMSSMYGGGPPPTMPMSGKGGYGSMA